MTYPDDVLKAAREAAAKYWKSIDAEEFAADCRDGKDDESNEVKCACIAIMAERQRCAAIARSTEAYDDRLQQASGFLTTGQRIARAIMAERERAHAGSATGTGDER